MEDKDKDWLMSAKQVLEVVPFSRTHLWRLERDGLFPKRVKIGLRKIAWRASAIQKWIDETNMRKDT